MRPVILDNAKRLLFMPELFGYFLTGIMYTEYTFASTSQLLDAKKREWDFELIEKLGLNKELFGSWRSASRGGGGDGTFRCEGDCRRKPRHGFRCGRRADGISGCGIFKLWYLVASRNGIG